MRFILRYRGEGLKPAADIRRIRALQDAQIIDDGPRMLLVDAPEVELKQLMEQLPDWVMSPERMIRLPDPHPNPRRTKGPR